MIYDYWNPNKILTVIACGDMTYMDGMIQPIIDKERNDHPTPAPEGNTDPNKCDTRVFKLLAPCAS
jgi:hypothetical protein